MSKPGDFDRIDRPELRGKDEAMASFKARTDPLIVYRDAYFALAQRDPGAVKGFPHPDGPLTAIDAAAALVGLRDVQSRLRAVPPREVQG